MPLRKIQPTNEEFYHLVKRGVEERKIFLDDEDRFRFLNSLLIFNDKAAAPWQSRAFWKQRAPDSLARSNYRPKTPLVEIHALSLMSNHFHLLVRQLLDNGIALFMQKLGGYSWYFNKKYQRNGTLFQDRYKIVHVKTENQLKNTFIYIHTNPLSLIEPGWKEWKIKNLRKAIKFLEQDYPWSSYQDYLGVDNFPSITIRSFFLELFGKNEEIKKAISTDILFKASITRPGGVAGTEEGFE